MASDQPRDPEIERNPRVCFCMGVHEAEIRAAIRNGAHDVETIRDQTGASSGCGTCRYDLIEILRSEGIDPTRGPS